MKPVRTKASTLVTTLLVLVVLSTIVLAFLQSVSMERLTSRSAGHLFQAELSARAGLQAAIAQIVAAAGTNNTFVTGALNYDPACGDLLVIGRTNLSDHAQLMPLVSAPADLVATVPDPPWSTNLPGLFQELQSTNSTDLNGRKGFVSSAQPAFRGAWVTVETLSNEPAGRYAYVVLDEQARLNPLLHTGAGGDGINWYNGPQDISLTNAAAQILAPDQLAVILASSNGILTPDALAQFFPTRAEYEAVKHLLTLQTNSSADHIPGALADAGKTKYNINDVATLVSHGATAEFRANRIAELIATNIPDFGSRDPSLRDAVEGRTRYLRRLAAGIIDYIDADTAPTAVNGGEPAGRDLFPLVAAVAERFQRVALSTNRHPALTTIESQCFVQLWNPYSTPIVLDRIPLRFVVRNRMKVRFGTGIVTPFEDYDTQVQAPITIRPNEFAVVEFPSVRQDWQSPGPVNSVPAWDDGPSGNADETTHSPFEFYVGGRLVDMNRRPPVGPGDAFSGMVRAAVSFTTTGNRWQCSFIPTQNAAPNWRFVGDCRATFLSNYDWQTLGNSSYATGTRWKGRQQDTAPRRQEFTRNWMARDYVPRNPSLGGAPSGVNASPLDVVSAYDPSTDADAAIAFLRNGPMRSIGELGHIFDPAQAADDLTAPNSSVLPFNNKISGGGRTLRIGQPEFSAPGGNNWDVPGRRALELLDLFTVNPAAQADGRINPNTAPPEVLAAVLSGIQITSDAGLAEARLTNAPAIAAEIVAHRPYSRISDLHRVIPQFARPANYSPPFPSVLSGGSTNLAAMDRVREEAFGRLVQHLSLQSRTYRILAAGEALDRRQRPRGRVVIEAIVRLQPDASGRLQPRVAFQHRLQ